VKYIGPGAVAIALTLFPHCWLAWLQPEREQGTIPGLRLQPQRQRILLGKAAAYWLVGMAEVLLVNLLACLSSGFGLLATPRLILGSCFYIACGVFWGIFLGSNTKSQSAVRR